MRYAKICKDYLKGSIIKKNTSIKYNLTTYYLKTYWNKLKQCQPNSRLQ